MIIRCDLKASIRIQENKHSLKVYAHPVYNSDNTGMTPGVQCSVNTRALLNSLNYLKCSACVHMLHLLFAQIAK